VRRGYFLLSRVDLDGAFTGKVCPDPPGALTLFQPNDSRTNPCVSSAAEMQNQVFAHTFSVREMFQIYDPPIRQTQKIHGNADYQVSNKRTKKKNSPPATVRGQKRTVL